MLQRNRTATELNGSATVTSTGGDRRHYQHPWPTSTLTRNGRRPTSGLSPESRIPGSTPNASDPTPAKAPKWIAARFYRLKTGHALTATHLKWIKLREDDQCWWCCRSRQTWEHLFKHCNRWRAQHKAMWAKVEKDIKRGKRKRKMAELFADERCSEAILESSGVQTWAERSRWRRQRRRAVSRGRSRVP